MESGTGSLIKQVPEMCSVTRIAVFGDSIAHGFHDPSGGWVARLREDVEQGVIGTGEKGSTVYGLGVSGDTTDDVVKRFEDEMAARYEDEYSHVVVFALGANDAVYDRDDGGVWVGPEAFRENIRTLAKNASARAEHVVFVGPAPIQEELLDPVPWAESWSYSMERIRAYDQMLEEEAGNTGAVHISLCEALPDRFLQTLDDGIHPVQEGHEMIYSVVRDRLVHQDLV